MAATSIAPALYISHGGPTNAVSKDRYSAELTAYGQQTKALITAIVVVSAHTLTEGSNKITITAGQDNKLIYDFYGFPNELYHIKYPAPGKPELANRIAELVKAAGFEPELNSHHGIDHGTWVPLLQMFPDANIPVIQVSLPFPGESAPVFKLGEALRPLREQGVMLIGSGSCTHNLGKLVWDAEENSPKHKPDKWARAFHDWMQSGVEKKKIAELLDWKKAPNVREAHPNPDHLFPLFFTLGCMRQDDVAATVSDTWQLSNLSMYTFAFQAQKK